MQHPILDASLLHAAASQFVSDLVPSNSLPVPQKPGFVPCDEHFGISQQAAFCAAALPLPGARGLFESILGFKNSSPQAN